MAEYIEKDRLYKMVAEKEETARNWVLETPTNSPAYMRYVAQLNERTAFKQMVADLPAVNVAEVVRGKWRFEKGDGKTCVDGWVCSACNCGFHTNVPYFSEYNFCPNCGADMREEG